MPVLVVEVTVMNNRIALGIIALLAIGTIIRAIPYTNTSSGSSRYPNDCQVISQGPTPINLTWTSRWSLFPQQVENLSTLAGDHVTLNVTYTGLSEFSKIEMYFAESNLTVSNTTRSVRYDTYQIIGNSTQDVHIHVLNALNESVAQAIYLTVSFGNWFSPFVIVNYPLDVGEDVFNFTWSATDQNADDVNFYQVWLSIDGGLSYQILANNLTQTFYLLDVTGFLSRDGFIVRIRAFSVDVSVYAGPFFEIPGDYWPGDYGDGFVEVYSQNGIPTGTTSSSIQQPHPSPILEMIFYVVVGGVLCTIVLFVLILYVKERP
jgi:hypothetical protein